MSSSISLVTYAGQTVTPQDDALVYESALGDGGIIYGGEVTLKNANTLHINAGHGVIAGRKFTIFASDIAIPLSASGTLLGRLYIHMDLGNTSDPIDILYETGNSLTPPVQDADVNIINGVFEFNLATFTVSTSTIADLSNIYPQIQYANSGSFIYVDTISPELIGAQVEVTDGVDTITAIFDANGQAELKNVFMTGTLQVTTSAGIYTAGTTINVPYFGTYKVSLALWMATLNISTSNPVLFGQQITITDSSSAVIGTTTFSNVGTATFIVGAPDVYTLSVTYGGNTYTSTVNVTSETTYNVSINTLPDGATVTPTDDITTWLACAGITDLAYTTLNEVLADSETYNALLGDSNACAYMKRSTTWSTDICASQYAMNLLGQYDTACDALLSDATWASAIANSTYWESVLYPLVPKMTSDTTPSGEAFCSYYYATDDNKAYKAFDGNASTYWYTGDAGESRPNTFVGYQFANNVKVAKIVTTYSGYASAVFHQWDITAQASDDGTTYSNITTPVQTSQLKLTTETKTIVCDNVVSADYIKVKFDSSGVGAQSSPEVYSIQFYGRKSSGGKIHGGNPTYDSFYYIDGGNNVPVTDPSLLDAGTYTIYSNGLAKDPDNLSNDYGKTIRICPNTKEIVVRPDNSLYWYGSECASGGFVNENINASSQSMATNDTSISVTATNGAMHCYSQRAFNTAHCTKLLGHIDVTGSGNGSGGFLSSPIKTGNPASNEYGRYSSSMPYSGVGDVTLTNTGDVYTHIYVSLGNITATQVTHALWYE